MLKTYLQDIAKKYLQGDAREETYYEVLSSLIQDYAKQNQQDIEITTLPKQTEAGNPDFRIWDGKAHVIGYIEAKKPSTENLDRIETSRQLQRYLSTFPNVILTNFHEFRLYRDGNLIERTSIARFFTLKELKQVPTVEKQQEFLKLLDRFLSFRIPRITTASNLAVELAKRTRFLRDEIIKIELEEEKEAKHKPLTGFYNAFKQYLIYSITPQQFADLYAQTLTYGLFAARTRANEDFNRELAYKYIPTTIGILRDIFRFISLEDPPKTLKIIVDDIAEILKVTQVNKILDRYFQEGKGKDPIIHFYETFLSKYDPEIKEKRGVYYTPEPVVKYIVNSLHQVLKDEFGLQDGFASEDVTVLDPAAGTLTFPAEAIKIAVEEHSKYGSASTNSFIRNSILKNFYAFELMMAPYAIGHLKMGFIFEELGYKMSDEERFKLYLTNTLEMEELEEVHIPGLSSLTDENHYALEVKQREPILVIMGNPPYSGISSNNNDWTERLLKTNIDDVQNYYEVDGKPLGERNPKWLQDDYVKFLRFAQWKIAKAGKGVVGMITNHSYLDNPTFKGMRQSLLKTYNKIFIINLHGNSLKKENCPDGSKDENVFDIRQGVAIAIFVKTESDQSCEVYYKDLFGKRPDKYSYLEENSLAKTEFEKLNPQSPYYFLIKRNTSTIQHYLKWDKVNEIFPVNSVGIVTARDKFAITNQKNELYLRLKQYIDEKVPDELFEKTYHIKNKVGWKIRESRKAIKRLKKLDSIIQEISYRPFDNRYVAYHPGLVERDRYNVMQHMLADENFGLVVSRQVKTSPNWQHSFISNKIVESCLISNRTSEINYLYPLYLYNEAESENLIERMEPGKQVNIAKKILDKLASFYGELPEPEAILQYIYGVFYSNAYRQKYQEFLKIDFPRVPFTKEKQLFYQMAEYGKRLIDLHLLQSSELDPPVARYEGQGDNDRIEQYKYKDGRVYINDEKYFEGITKEVWDYEIGGYQVMRKYLRSRKNRLMQDARHYCQIATAIAKTIEIQASLDEIFTQIEESV
jgi:predicted helicase